ncbi:MAG: BamA/TamA family outer membrane protein [Flavobacteriales bacterium]|nr:BamA/TamA family outer membrane protein [Flavobacteriales bacterium]
MEAVNIHKFIKFCIKLLFFAVVGNIFFSCQTSKVPDGKYLLTKNEYDIKGKDVHKSLLPEYVKQKPNAKMFFILPFELWMYNYSNKKLDESFEEYDRIIPSERSQAKLDSILINNGLGEYAGKSYWLQRQMHKLGSPPTIIDTLSTESSTIRLQKFYQSKGYFDAVSSFKVEPKGKKKAKITYSINPGKVTKIKEYSYNIPYDELRELYLTRKKNEFIKVGNPLDQQILKKEIERLENNFKNNGYYDINNTREIYFKTDTINKEREVPLQLVIKRDTLVDSTGKFRKYYYNKITINDFRPSRNSNTENITTTNFENYILNSKHNKYTKKALTNLVIIEPNDLYSQKDIVATKRRIYASNNFDISDFVIKKAPASDSLLDVQIYLNPKKKFDLDFSSDVQYSELLNFGFSPGINFKMRNIFGGAENLDIGLQGTFGTVKFEDTSKNKPLNASDVSLQAKISYPKILFPYADKLISKKMTPSSELIFRINQQKNIGLGRVNATAGLNYYIQPKETIKHRLNLLNTQYTNITQPENYFSIFSSAKVTRDKIFANYFESNPSLETQYSNNEVTDDYVIQQIEQDINYLEQLRINDNSLYLSYRNMEARKRINTANTFNNSFIYEFEYNEKVDALKTHPFYLNVKTEYSGALLHAVDNIFNLNGKIFNVNYTQFTKFDVDIRKYWNINKNHQIAFRQFAGIAIPIGDNFIPFYKSYFMGGSNDLRAWTPYSVGPAGRDHGDFSVDTFKLLSSLEYRFPLSGSLQGALFVDAGNIWSSQKKSDFNPIDSNFDISDFYNELAIGSGLGFRYDFKYLIFRFDLAYKLANPHRPLGNRFDLTEVNLLKPTINFAINYPF